MSDVAILAAGCFWGIEDKFSSAEGVIENRGWLYWWENSIIQHIKMYAKEIHFMLKQLEYFLMKK